MNTLYKCAVVVLILGVAATTGRGAISISVVDSGDLDPGTIYNLTELGMTDWVLYTDADLTPDEQKNGGTAIGALTLDVGGVTAVNSGYNPRFSWSDGDPSGTVSTANADPDFLLTSDEAVATLSLEVAADNRPSTL